MAPHSSTLAWKIPWTEEPGGAAVHRVAEGRTWLSSFHFHFHFSLSCIGEGNGNQLQCSCLENPRDGRGWWAAVHGVAKSQTRLSDFTFTFHLHALEKEMNPLQCSCLENPKDGGVWWAAIYGVSQSQTRLKWLSSSSILWMGFPSGSLVKNLPAMQETRETWVQSLDWEDPLEEYLATHSSTLAWEIPWTEEPGELQSKGSQGVWHDWAHTAAYLERQMIFLTCAFLIVASQMYFSMLAILV